jgi:hypothetical protein
MLWWDRYGYHKKCAGTCYAELVFLHPVGSMGHVVHSCIWGAKHRCTIFHCRVDLVRFPFKAHQDTVQQTCVFAFGGICWSHSAFGCIWGVKRRRTIFDSLVGLVWFP